MRFIQIGVDDLIAVGHIIRVKSTGAVPGAATTIHLIDGSTAYTLLTVAQVLNLSGGQLAVQDDDIGEIVHPTYLRGEA